MTTTQASSLPSVQDIELIARTADPAIRNLRITHAYHLLAVAFADVAGQGCNWCTFAVWASKQAGQTIRGEDLVQVMERALHLHPEVVEAMNGIWRRVLGTALERPDSKRARILRILGQDAFSRASDAIARGNRKVFEEIGREFARFLPLCASGRVDPDALSGFLSGLRPGDPPGGQDHLRRAFTHYARGLEVVDPRERAELQLLANLLVGLHEQTRLQPEILEALEVPFTTVTELGQRILSVIVPSSREWRGFARWPVAVLLGGFGRLSEHSIRTWLRHAVTESLMTLRLPDGVVRLGRDLPGELPDSLRDARNAELLALLARLQPTERDPDGAGADDWSVLQERMILIGRLFRTRHEDARLFERPFTPEQVLAFETGRVPEGPL